MLDALKNHPPEYLIEAWCLATFMLSACAFSVLLFQSRVAARRFEFRTSIDFDGRRDGLDGDPRSSARRLSHWETSFLTQKVDNLLQSFTPDFVSTGVVNFAEPRLGFRKAAMIRDPDGHAVRLTER